MSWWPVESRYRCYVAHDGELESAKPFWATAPNLAAEKFVERYYPTLDSPDKVLVTGVDDYGKDHLVAVRVEPAVVFKGRIVDPTKG